MKFQVLGPIRIVRDDRTISLGPPKQRALLAVLLMHANEVLASDRVVEALWGDDPPLGGVKALHVHVAALRKVLEPDRPRGRPSRVLVTQSPGYVLKVDDGDLDAVEFERLIETATDVERRDPECAVELLDQALGLWRGRPYDDVAYEEFAQGEIRRLEEVKIRAEEANVEAQVWLGRHHSLIGRLEALVGDHPLHEPFWCLLMTTLYRSGRQPDALAAYRRACAAFGDLGTAPSRELVQLESQILLRDPVLDERRNEPRAKGNLPSDLSSFVGRETEAHSVAELVRTNRMVTLVGPGGVGKSRLGIAAAKRLPAEFTDGAWLVDLATVDEGTLLASRIGHVLGVARSAGIIDDLDRLVQHLSQRNLLLLLDNCEHLIEPLAKLGRTLLTRCERLHILATSRHPLGIEGEVLSHTQPLSVEASQDGRSSPAVELFLDRASAVRLGLEKMSSDRELVIQVCRSVAGLPLAIELAAARLRIMSLEQLARRGAGGVAILDSGQARPVAHHQAMRTTLEWSYQLLEPSEQALFRRLAVFRDGFTIDAVERFHTRVPDTAGDAIQLVTALVDSSMIVDAKGDRLVMLEPIRQYARLLLDEAGETSIAQRCHAEVLREMFRVPESALFEPEALVAGITQLVQIEHDNVTAALDWALSAGEISIAMELTWLVGYFVMRTHSFREALRRDQRALATSSEPTRARARVLARVCFLTHHLYGSAAALRLVDELSRTAEALDDDAWRAAAEDRRADVVADGDEHTAECLYRKAIERLLQLQHPEVTTPLINLAELLTFAGHFEEADRVAKQLVQVAGAVQAPQWVAHAQNQRSYIALCRGDLEASAHYLVAADDSWSQSYALLIRGYLALLGGDLAEAERLAWIVITEARATGRFEPLGRALVVMALIHLERNDAGAAVLFLIEAVAKHSQLDDVWLQRHMLGSFAACWARIDSTKGAMLLAATAADHRRSDTRLPYPIARVVQQGHTLVQQELTADDLRAARTRGESMTLDQAIRLATSM